MNKYVPLLYAIFNLTMVMRIDSLTGIDLVGYTIVYVLYIWFDILANKKLAK